MSWSRTCHACRRILYAEDVCELPLVERHRRHHEDVQQRTCVCGTAMYVFSDNLAEMTASIKILLDALNGERKVPLAWATRWSGHAGEEPVARAWRYCDDAYEMIRLLSWWDDAIGWLAAMTARDACGSSDEIVVRRDDMQSPHNWASRLDLWSSEAAVVVDRIRERFTPPTLVQITKRLKEAKAA